MLYACSLTKALYLEVLPNLETTTLMPSLKRFIAEQGRPSKILSDNERTFVGATKQADARLPSIGEDHMEIQPEPSTLVGRLVWSAWWASLNALSTK